MAGDRVATTFTASHWGTYQVLRDARGTPRLDAVPWDPNPSPIGLWQLDPALDRVRVRAPSVRRSWLEHGSGSHGALRGDDPFVEIGWDDALDLVAGELGRIRAAHGNAAIFGGSYGWSSAGRFHHAQSQVHRFLNTIGGYVRSVDTYSLGAGNVIMPHVVAPMDELLASHTSWPVLVENTELFVGFGGVPLKNCQVSPGGVGRHVVRDHLGAMARRGVRIVNISPVCDNLDAGGSVEWLPIRPGTDTALMLGIAYVLTVEKLVARDFLATHCVGYEQFEAYLLGRSDNVAKTPAWADRISGVPSGRIERLAREMAHARTMINAAFALQRASHGEQPFWMVVTLAAMLGQIGLPGGGFGVGYGAANMVGHAHPRIAGPTLPQGDNPVAAFIPVSRIADMLLSPGERFGYDGRNHVYPDIRLIYWAGGNPFHHHQDLNRLRYAWRAPETIVVHEQFWTATARHADIVLPATTTLERNDIGYAGGEGFLVAMKQVREPFALAMNDFDIFAGIADRLGAKERFTENLDELGWLRQIYDTSARRNRESGLELPPFEQFWEEGRVGFGTGEAATIMLDGFRRDPERNRLQTPSGKIEIFSKRIASFNLPDCPGHAVWSDPAEWLGGPKAAVFPLHLLSDQPARRLHSQLDASPHSIAEKVAGREPVHLNAEDARGRGIVTGDVVEVWNDRGRMLAGAIVGSATMQGVVRISTGAWLDLDAESGIELHGNRGHSEPAQCPGSL